MNDPIEYPVAISIVSKAYYKIKRLFIKRIVKHFTEPKFIKEF